MELLSKSEGKNSPFISLGKIIAPHGIQGALKIHCLSDFPERLLELTEIYLLADPDADQAQGPFKVLSIQQHKAKVFILSLANVKTRNQAETIDKYFVAVPATETMELPEDTFYARDLIGFEVYEQSGAKLGVVTQLVQGHQDLIVFETPAKTEHWIPFVFELVPEVDIKNQRLVICPPAGLMEL